MPFKNCQISLKLTIFKSVSQKPRRKSYLNKSPTSPGLHFDISAYSSWNRVNIHVLTFKIYLLSFYEGHFHAKQPLCEMLVRIILINFGYLFLWKIEIFRVD